METKELRALFAKLPETERLALDETVMDQGINNFDGLMKTMELVTTYFNEQPGAKLTFRQFQITRKAVTWDEARCLENGLDKESAEVFEYEDQCFIEVKGPNSFYLIIESSEWYTNDLGSLERLLYDRWYL